MKKLLIAFLCLLMNNVYAYTNATVYDPIGERILYSFNGEDKRLIASTTKVMTAVIALENSDLSSEFIVDKNDIDTYGSSIYLKQNDKITTYDLIHGLLLRSGNDAALTLANNIYGYKTFIDLMNIKASSIGMKDTIFNNPHGLDDETKNYSTTNDMCKLMSYAINNNEFNKISSSKKYVFNNTEWYNKNELLSYYKYNISGKTGYTPKAGYTFVSASVKDNKTLVITTFNDKDRFNTHKKLYQKYFMEYELYNILDKNTFYIDNNLYKDEYLYIKNNYSMLLNSEEKNNLLIDIYLYDNKILDKCGYVSVKLNDIEVHREYIYGINYSVRKRNIIDKIKSLFT